MIKSLLKYKNTFEKFKKFIIFRNYQKTFNKLSEVEKILILIEFLAEGGIPIIEALIYYNYKYPHAKFEDKLKNLILKEFYRIENNIECNYIPF